MSGELLVAIALVTAAVAVTLLVALAVSRLLGAYDDIGGGMFDRPRGDGDGREPPDAEYEEFAAALHSLWSEPRPHDP